MVLQRDFDHDGVRQAQRLLVQQGRVAFDHAGFFQRLDPVPAGRGRQPHLFGQLQVGKPTVRAQRAQDLAVGFVDFGRDGHDGR
ncbi:hypothetical protein D9M70_580790 [compost metagenome]